MANYPTSVAFFQGKPSRQLSLALRYLVSASVRFGQAERVRSYSMNCFLGLFSQCPSCFGEGIDHTFQGLNEVNNNWSQYLKLSDIPKPSQIFVVLDEHPDSINDGYWGVGIMGNDTYWQDLPASFHNGAAGYSFSDGHSEIHKWLDSSTLLKVVPGQPFNPRTTGPDTRDRIWAEQHTAIK